MGSIEAEAHGTHRHQHLGSDRTVERGPVHQRAARGLQHDEPVALQVGAAAPRISLAEPTKSATNVLRGRS